MLKDRQFFNSTLYLIVTHIFDTYDALRFSQISFIFNEQIHTELLGNPPPSPGTIPLLLWWHDDGLMKREKDWPIWQGFIQFSPQKTNFLFSCKMFCFLFLSQAASTFKTIYPGLKHKCFEIIWRKKQLNSYISKDRYF